MIKITRDEAIERTARLGETYMLVQLNPSTTLLQLARGVEFFIPDDDPDYSRAPAEEPVEPVADPKVPAEEPVREEQPTAEDQKEQKPNKKPKKTAKNAVDHGKICACFIGGWSVAKIADECRCSEQTVRNHLKQEGLMR